MAPPMPSRRSAGAAATVLLAALGAAVHAESSDPATRPIFDVLNRTCGPRTAAIFELKLDPSMAQGFSLAAAAGSNGGEATVAVTASGLPELGYGAGYYLRTQCGMSFAWERSGGHQVRPPEGGFPGPSLRVAPFRSPSSRSPHMLHGGIHSQAFAVRVPASQR